MAVVISQMFYRILHYHLGHKTFFWYGEHKTTFYVKELQAIKNHLCKLKDIYHLTCMLLSRCSQGKHVVKIPNISCTLSWKTSSLWQILYKGPSINNVMYLGVTHLWCVMRGRGCLRNVMSHQNVQLHKSSIEFSLIFLLLTIILKTFYVASHVSCMSSN